jgi:hypothetical protein
MSWPSIGRVEHHVGWPWIGGGEVSGSGEHREQHEWGGFHEMHEQTGAANARQAFAAFAETFLSSPHAQIRQAA